MKSVVRVLSEWVQHVVQGGDVAWLTKQQCTGERREPQPERWAFNKQRKNLNYSLLCNCVCPSALYHCGYFSFTGQSNRTQAVTQMWRTYVFSLSFVLKCVFFFLLDDRLIWQIFHCSATIFSKHLTTEHKFHHSCYKSVFKWTFLLLFILCVFNLGLLFIPLWSLTYSSDQSLPHSPSLSLFTELLEWGGEKPQSMNH